MDNSEAIVAAVRLKPIPLDKIKWAVVSKERSDVLIKNPNNVADVRKFSYDHVYDENTSQKQLYNALIKPLVHQALLGHNVSIIVYGQRHSGKNFTLLGVTNPAMNIGVIPRLISDIFQNKQADLKVKASFFNIYNEKVRDLLYAHSERDLDIDPSEMGFHTVRNLTQKVVDCPEELVELYEKGLQDLRFVKLEQPHQSHQVLRLYLKQSIEGHNLMNLIDIVKVSGIERDHESVTEEHLLQSKIQFNQVVHALADKQHAKFEGAILTKVLKEALEGNCKTAIIGQVERLGENYEWALQTLSLLEKLRGLRTKPDWRKNTLGDEQIEKMWKQDLQALKQMRQF